MAVTQHLLLIFPEFTLKKCFYILSLPDALETTNATLKGQSTKLVFSYKREETEKEVTTALSLLQK